jgi:hypothetical protein
LPGHEGTLSARLWYRAEEPLTDAELTRWAAHVNRNGRLIDPALFRPVQATYIASPVFEESLPDPLPCRCGVRQGLEDTVCVILPPPDPANPEEVSGEGYHAGLGVDAYLAMIGGGQGFREPIVKAIASFIAINGSTADCSKLKEAIQESIDAADPGGRSAEQLDRYKSDAHLDDIISWVRQHHGDQPPKGWTQQPPPGFDDPRPAKPEPDDRQSVPPVDRPILRLVSGALPYIVDEAERLLLARDRGIFAFGDQVVRPALRQIQVADDKTVAGLRLVPIAAAHMIERFTRHIEFQRFDLKRQAWVATNCPRNVAIAYLERIGLWHLPQITALVSCPLLLAGGRILDKPGFDDATGILFDPQGVSFPPVPEFPTETGAHQALDTLLYPFRDFPFVDEPSKSVLLSLLLSSVSRHAFPFVPCHGFDAPAIGTGKSKIFDCASILLTGRECAVVSQPDDETEFEKKLFAILLQGDPLVSIDNCSHALDNPFMCMMLTQRYVQSRILGLAKTASIPNTAILGANGCNFSFAGDMLRRGLTGHLDAGMEKPWEREFDSEDPVVVFKRDRARIVVAALTVLRGYLAAGRPKQRAPPLGGFEEYTRMVRDPLLWLGQADPCLTIEATRKADPTLQKLEAVITQWHDVLGNRSLTTREVVEEACRAASDLMPSNPNRIIYFHPEFRNALLDVANEGGRVSVDRLGYWLRDNKHKVVRVLDAEGACQCRLIADPPVKGYARWRLEEKR